MVCGECRLASEGFCVRAEEEEEEPQGAEEEEEEPQGAEEEEPQGVGLEIPVE